MVYKSFSKADESYIHASSIVRYNGFLFIQQKNQSWLIRPEKSPLRLLPFRTSICSLEEAKGILDNKLLETEENLEAA